MMIHKATVKKILFVFIFAVIVYAANPTESESDTETESLKSLLKSDAYDHMCWDISQALYECEGKETLTDKDRMKMFGIIDGYISEGSNVNVLMSLVVRNLFFQRNGRELLKYLIEEKGADPNFEDPASELCLPLHNIIKMRVWD